MQNEPSNQKDLTLLRPFDLEKAMNGELLCFNPGIAEDWDQKLQYIGEDLQLSDHLCFKFISGEHSGKILSTRMYCIQLKMSPLGWVENKPVYPEDVLYWNVDTYDKGTKFVAKKYFKEDAIAGYAYFPDGTKCEDENAWVNVEYLTWEKPKAKKSKKIWINIYPGMSITTNGSWFSSIEAAQYSAHYSKYTDDSHCIGQKELIVEWEE